MESIPCCNLVYVLELEGGNFYCGRSTSLNIRLAQHWTGGGSKWTRLHKPIKIIKVCMGGEAMERKVTLEMMREKGWQCVRGGPWCRVKLKRAPADLSQ